MSSTSSLPDSPPESSSASFATSDRRPSDQDFARVLLQRVRNRLIEYLEVAASFEAQQAFLAQSPDLDVPNEIIQQWSDWVSPNWRFELIMPVFSEDELLAIQQFQTIWQALAEDLVQPLPTLSILQQSPLWEKLRLCAEHTLHIFMIRGRLSEEQIDQR
ncbi:hypothetical protein [Undibacterium danionis]|uniref:Uncharacterized protein n=1 Tax=Undibacterium danionis TaxID=1812100 RepID=A0ABV6II20_9BURK